MKNVGTDYYEAVDARTEARQKRKRKYGGDGNRKPCHEIERGNKLQRQRSKNARFVPIKYHNFTCGKGLQNNG